MAQTVTSKFNRLSLLTFILGSLFIGIIVLVPVVVVLLQMVTGGSIQILLLTAAFGLSGWFYYRSTYASLVRITAAAEGLIFMHVLTRKKTIINYADIIHVESITLVKYDRYSGPYLQGPQLNIFLKNGHEVSFLEEYYTNYDELKDAIRRHRFNLQ